MKKNRLKYIQIIVIILLLSVANGYSQDIKVHSYLDTNTILIGDQIKYHVEITLDRNIDITFPFFTDTIVDKVEILEQSKSDTTYLSSEVLKINKEFTITSFDSGFYVLPAIKIPYVINNNYDTALSEILILGVYTFEIDSVTGITDIKYPIDTPITFKEIVPWIGYGVLAILVILILVWLLIKYKKNEPVIIRREKQKEPAHVIALRDLDKLKSLKLWQQGKTKEYYSNLTEALRTYLENRYEIHAMEQTSDEILNNLNKLKIMDTSSFEKLEKILLASDFVKFAKFQPLPDQNEISLDQAYEIVMKTKFREDLTSKKEDNKLNINEDKLTPEISNSSQDLTSVKE